MNQVIVFPGGRVPPSAVRYIFGAPVPDAPIAAKSKRVSDAEVVATMGEASVLAAHRLGLSVRQLQDRRRRIRQALESI